MVLWYNKGGEKMKKLILLLLFFLIGCQSEYVTNETSFFAMDTYINIRVYSKQEEAKILKEAEELFMYYHRLTDRYNSYEDVINVYDINNMKDDYLVLDEELAYLVDFGLRYYEKSNGLFDIAMGDLIDVWKKHINEYDFLPDVEILKQVEKTEIMMVYNKIYSGVNIDLGGIAKGYAVLKVGELLENNGYDKFIINAGGQVLLGESYRRDLYKVGIKHPLESGNLLVVSGENMNVSTSGSYERFFTIEEVNYHHIINPHTLFPADYFLSVSVISEDSLLADVLTTVLFLMPLEEGMAFLENYPAEAVWYTKDEEIIRSEGFHQYE